MIKYLLLFLPICALGASTFQSLTLSNGVIHPAQRTDFSNAVNGALAPISNIALATNAINATNLMGNVNISQVVSPGQILTNGQSVAWTNASSVYNSAATHYLNFGANGIGVDKSAASGVALDVSGELDATTLYGSTKTTCAGTGYFEVWAKTSISAAAANQLMFSAYGKGNPGITNLYIGNAAATNILLRFDVSKQLPASGVPNMAVVNGAGGLANMSVSGTLTCSNLVANAAFDLMPVGSTTTNSGAVRFWNSNNAAIYARGTNGVDKLVTSWP